MKKTLIALAVAASAVVSGSAMASSWSPSGAGGSVDMGGMLTPKTKETPWEVKVGDAVKGLDAKIEKGQKVVDIPVKQAIPLLGIRTQTKEPFHGQKGISPQISYGNAVKTDQFDKGHAPLTLEVKDSNGVKIGTAETSVLAAALASFDGQGGLHASSLYAAKSGNGFFGGVGKNAAAVVTFPIAATSGIFAEATEHYTTQGFKGDPVPGDASFSNPKITYSAFYASGIEKDKNIKITLDKAACCDAPIQWKA
ncbi:hypothetical protein I8B79_004750, partial [Salmonella enterica]|nr:hypothetical protein [Salmonella enterica]